jgi:hypothetical protein
MVIKRRKCMDSQFNDHRKKDEKTIIGSQSTA